MAHVWLASNYDKKLSKQQFLNTDIVSTSKIVSRSQLNASSTNLGEDTITLRLSSQLLLGIVRIYLRKTKYLLDDVHETLYKLKNSFKYASGASLGPTVASTVNLPPQRTTLSNTARIQLQDQVTDLDLFYQEDLVLDDDPTTTAEAIAISELDRLIEVGRNAVDADVDFDLDLDFDLDVDNSADQSIEQGRDAQTAMQDADQSIFDIASKTNPDASQLDFNLSEPLEPRPTEPNSAGTEPLTPGRPEAPIQAPISTARRARTGVDNGVIRTAKRKIIIDTRLELERGIPNSVFREIQYLQSHRRFTTDMLTLNLSLQDKLELIEELAEPLISKRRKIGNLDEQLRRRCLELSLDEAAPEIDNSELESGLEMDTEIDFDLSLPDLESDSAASPERSNEQSDKVLEDDIQVSEDSGVENLRATAQVAGHLRDAFMETPRVSFDQLIEMDMKKSDLPLGATTTMDSSIKVSGRREATKCFFELLVLASQDCITLEQSLPNLGKDLPDNPYIRPRDNLVTKFL